MRIHRIDDGLIAIAQIGASQRGGAVMVRWAIAGRSAELRKGEYLALGLRSMVSGNSVSAVGLGEVRSLGTSTRTGTPAIAQGRVSRRMIRPSALCIGDAMRKRVRVVKQNSLGHRQKLYFTAGGREHGRDTFAV